MRRNDEIRHAIRPPSLLAAAALALACLGGWPIPASAQPNSTLGHSSPWDLTIAAGALAARPELESSDRYRDEWYNTGQLALVVGRHLTPHFKVELEASTAAEGHQFVERYVTVPNAAYPVPYATERFTTLRQVSGSVIWQFFENEWAHPFVQAGVAADVERVRSFTPAQTFYIGDPRLPGSRVDDCGRAARGARYDHDSRSGAGRRREALRHAACVRADRWPPDRQPRQPSRRISPGSWCRFLGRHGNWKLPGIGDRFAGGRRMSRRTSCARLLQS